MTDKNLVLYEDIQSLVGVPETLLIPLYARALAREYFPGFNFEDRYAEELVQNIKLDPWRFAADDPASVKGVIIREKWFDEQICRFFKKNPDGLCLNLGAGLDASYFRVRDKLTDFDINWIDGDLPEVMDIRRDIYDDNPYYHQMDLDLTDTSWIETIDFSSGQPIMVSIQGVLMYLEKQEVSTLLMEINDQLGRERNMELILDYCAPLLVKGSIKHPSVKKTNSVFKWGEADVNEIGKPMFGIKIRDEKDLMKECGFGAKVISGLYTFFTRGKKLYGCVRFSNLHK